VVSGLSGYAWADDINPPPWRGGIGTTFTHWGFGTNDNTPSPDNEVNPYGSASAEVWPGVGQLWWATWGGRDGVWPLSGAMEFEIPNRPYPFEYKDIWVQVTWAQQAPGTYPIVSETLSAENGTVINEVTLEATGEPYPAGEHWMHTTYLIHIEPNPSYEIVRIDGAVMVDQVVIDTQCIPEPVTLSLLSLGLGGAAVLRRRRR
jgi:hypothetical protein